MNTATVKVKAKSYFEVFKRDQNNELNKASGICENQITDFGYQTVYGLSGFANVFPGSTAFYTFAYCAVGPSNTPIAAEDIGLSTVSLRIQATAQPRPENATNELVEIAGVWYVKTTAWYVFGLGALDNVTFSQLGLFSGNNNTTLLCGQLTKDEFGDPTSITVLVTEQLMIKYTMYWPAILLNQVIGSFNFDYNSVNYSAILRNITYDMAAGSIVFMPQNSGVIGANSFSNVGTFTSVRTLYANRIERIFNISIAVLGITENIAVIRITLNSTSPVMAVEIDPPLPKTAYNTLSFSFRWIIQWREA